MRIPDSLATLYDQGIITDVLRPLMSGKEAQIYLVTTSDQLCVAKVYKEAQNRSFKHRADYTEGRKVRNSRDQRAMAKRSKHGREQEEAAWKSTEVDVIYRLHAGGVRVPVPHHFIDGVLVMELIADAEGNPAPRLGDLTFEPEMATRIYQRLIRDVMRMLCSGIVHGDLSDFNVLLGADGPVIIDFPQSVDTAHNSNARQLLLRDVENLHNFHARFVPNARRMPYAEEMWDLHQKNALSPDTQLTGRYQSSRRQADIGNVLSLIDDANRDERKRRDALGLRGGPPRDVNNEGRGGSPRTASDGRGVPSNGRGASPMRDGNQHGAPSNGRGAPPMRDGNHHGAPSNGRGASPMRDGNHHGAPSNGRGAPPMRDGNHHGAPSNGRGAPPMRDGNQQVASSSGRGAPPMRDGNQQVASSSGRGAPPSNQHRGRQSSGQASNQSDPNSRSTQVTQRSSNGKRQTSVEVVVLRRSRAPLAGVDANGGGDKSK